MENFIEAVRTRKSDILKAPLLQGHYSSAWCELANVGYKTGAAYSKGEALEINKGMKAWGDLLDAANARLEPLGVTLDDPAVKLSPVLEMDTKSEKFTGAMADNRHDGRCFMIEFKLLKEVLMARKHDVGLAIDTALSAEGRDLAKRILDLFLNTPFAVMPFATFISIVRPGRDLPTARHAIVCRDGRDGLERRG